MKLQKSSSYCVMHDRKQWQRSDWGVTEIFRSAAAAKTAVEKKKVDEKRRVPEEIICCTFDVQGLR